jgi:hypothetical protein
MKMYIGGLIIYLFSVEVYKQFVNVCWLNVCWRKFLLAVEKASNLK